MITKTYETLNELFEDFAERNSLCGGDSIHILYDGEDYDNIIGVEVKSECGSTIAKYEITESC